MNFSHPKIDPVSGISLCVNEISIYAYAFELNPLYPEVLPEGCE
jgi:hypothetical protein